MNVRREEVSNKEFAQMFKVLLRTCVVKIDISRIIDKDLGDLHTRKMYFFISKDGDTGCCLQSDILGGKRNEFYVFKDKSKIGEVVEISREVINV